MQILLFIQTAFKDVLATLTACEASPAASAAALQNLCRVLAAQEAGCKNYQLPAPPFALEDVATHDVIIDCVRTCTAMLMVQALNLFHYTPDTPTQLRELERAFWRIDIPAFVLERQWKIVIWALFIVIPCSASDYDRLDAIELLSELCRKLRVSRWEDMRAFLTTYFFCDYVQDEPCRRLWMEIHSDL